MKLRLAFFLAFSATALPLCAAAPDIHDTRLLAEPAVSATRIAFIYAGDLWTCDFDGGNVRRLTSDVGSESRPAFSPDGKWIAFSAQYEGNTDVYAVSSEGGVPRRLTWHPGPDEVQGFTADGRSVLFTSPRNVFTGRYTPAGSSRVEPGLTPQTDVTLSWTTFSDAADEAGISRRYGGIHFEEGDLLARLLGREVAGNVWDKAQSYINGTAP